MIFNLICSRNSPAGVDMCYLKKNYKSYFCHGYFFYESLSCWISWTSHHTGSIGFCQLVLGCVWRNIFFKDPANRISACFENFMNFLLLLAMSIIELDVYAQHLNLVTCDHTKSNMWVFSLICSPSRSIVLDW